MFLRGGKGVGVFGRCLFEMGVVWGKVWGGVGPWGFVRCCEGEIHDLSGNAAEKGWTWFDAGV